MSMAETIPTIILYFNRASVRILWNARWARTRVRTTSDGRGSGRARFNQEDVELNGDLVSAASGPVPPRATATRPADSQGSTRSRLSRAGRLHSRGRRRPACRPACGARGPLAD